MKALIGRLGSLNLSKPRFYDTSCLSNATKGFLSPSPITQIPNRGAKMVDSGIQWVRPEEPPCIIPEKSGDLEGVPEIPPDRVVAALRNSQVLKNAPAIVQQFYTFKYLDRVNRKTMIDEVLIDRVKRHNYDTQSDEVRLAIMTSHIRRLQVHMETSPRDYKSKIVLKELIEKRRKRLKFLRRCNYPLFEWVLEMLNIIYKPLPMEPVKAMRSFAMIEIAENFCEELKARRLAKYREELEERKPEFLERKARTMRAINEDEKKLQLKPSFTEEEILEVERLRSLLLEEQAKIPKPVEDIF